MNRRNFFARLAGAAAVVAVPVPATSARALLEEIRRLRGDMERAQQFMDRQRADLVQLSKYHERVTDAYYTAFTAEIQR